MKQTHLTILVLIGLLVAVGCSGQHTETSPVTDEKITVAATFFPLYELSEMVVGSEGEVFSIVPTHSEPHSFVPTPQDIVQLNKADVYVTLGVEFEEFEDELIESTQNVAIIKAAQGIEVIDIDEDEHETHDEEGHDEHDEHADEQEHDEHSEDEHHNEHDEHEEEEHQDEHEDEHDEHEDEHHEEHEEEHHDEHDHSGADPHVWLSPKNAIVMVQNIAQGLSTADPANKDKYQANAGTAASQLVALDSEFKTGLSSCAKDTILVAHNAYSYLGRDYGFKTIEIHGLSPESEPTPQQIASLIDEAKEHDLKYVFYEELVDPRVSNTIASQVGAETLALNPVAGSKDGSDTYLSIMRENLANLRIALECQ